MNSTPSSHIALVTLSMFFALPTLAAQELSVPTDTFTLANGLRVTVHEDHSAPLVAVNLWYHVGSGREVAGRTGFAHLFEHMMFQGSEHVGDDQHFSLIQEAGGTLNGSTNADRTNYFEIAPANYLELLLWLESDRMGFLLPAMTQEKLDNQRDVVKNERRQSYENRPYGMGFLRLGELLYPKDHPYHWPTIGSQQDLTAASLEDVKGFFRRWYAPNNASLVVAGDVETADVRRLAEKYFGGIPRGEAALDPAPRPAPLAADTRDVLEDRVTLPQVTLAWPTVPRWTDDDAALDVLSAVLGVGKPSRLYQRLVYREETAQEVSTAHFSRELAGTMAVTVQARDGQTLSAMERAVNEEIERLVREGPTEDELTRAKNGIEASFVYDLQTLLGKADQLNNYMTYRENPELFNEDLARYRKVVANDVQRVAKQYLAGPRVILSIVPMGRRDLAAQAPGATP